MQTLPVASVESVNVEQPQGKLTAASRPINISSVRAASLRTSGLRAALSRRGAHAQKEKQSVVTASGTETGMIVNQLSCLSSSVSMASSTQLSYTNSQDPGEDSQQNAFAMVDKLVNLNASLMWQTPESSKIVPEQSCAKNPQSNKGIQSLAHNADMKNLEEKMGIYDWIDSQPDKNGDIEQASPTYNGQQKEVGMVMPAKNRNALSGMVSDLSGCHDTGIGLVMAEEAPSLTEQNTGSSLCQVVSARAAEGNETKECSTQVAHWPFTSMQKLGVSLVVSNELHDTNASDDEGEAEIMDIGANTQIALEAMDIMRCGIQSNHESALCGKPMFDIGNDAQPAVDATDTMLNGDNAPPNENDVSSLFDVGNDTQMAIDAMDIMRRGVETDIVLPKEKATTSLFNIGNDTQTAIDAIAIMKQGTQPDIILSKAERQEEIERVQKLSPVCSTLGRKRGLLSKDSTVVKPVSKKSFSNSMSNTLKRQRSALSNPPARMVCYSKRRFLLDFSSTMVPRRKRSRLRALRRTLNVDGEVFGCQKHDFHLHKTVTKADRQAQQGKPASSESQKSDLWPKANGKSSNAAVFIQSTNGESERQTKTDISTKSDHCTLMEQSRKRRKCESRCVFVLFSHSLSEATIKKQKKMLIKLGGHVASSAAKATHFVVDSFTRSQNMLEMMAAGKVVVTTMWLEGCSQAEYFVDENSYILCDVQKEKQWGFCMHSSLAASRRKPLFTGLKVVVSPSTAPDFKAIKAVVESAGGQALQKLSNSPHSKADETASVSFVVGSEDDFDFCVEFLKKGCKVYSTELILQGVITQNLDLSRNCLFEDYMR